MEIFAFITNNAVPVPAPATTPTVDIRRADTMALVVSAATMTVVGDGWVSYDFAAALTGIKYVATVDADPGGAGQVNANERYHVVSFEGDNDTVVRQSWSRELPQTMKGVVHLEVGGDRASIDAAATCSFQAYDRAGNAIAGWSGAGALRLAGGDSFFDLSATLTAPPTPGEVVAVRVTIAGSGVGNGSHIAITPVAFPEF